MRGFLRDHYSFAKKERRCELAGNAKNTGVWKLAWAVYDPRDYDCDMEDVYGYWVADGGYRTFYRGMPWYPSTRYIAGFKAQGGISFDKFDAVSDIFYTPNHPFYDTPEVLDP